MDSEKPDNNPPDITPAELDPKFDASLEQERASAQTDTPATKAEAAQFDKGQTPSEALAEQHLKDQKRES